MVSLGELERGNDWKSRVFYRVLSFVSGQDLAETERQRLRKARKRQLEEWEEVGIGPPLDVDSTMEVVIDMCLKEALLMDDFEPDLLIVSPRQYKALFDIPAGVPVDPDDWHHYIAGSAENRQRDKERVQPPNEYTTDAGTIDVTYSDSTERMLLVESDSL